MEKYKRVEKNKQPEEAISENEIRITTQGKMRNYISYATNLFGPEKKQTVIVLKAMGRAINKTVTVAEILKRRIAGLHQTTSIDSTDITDVWEPIEEGLDRVETTRHVSSITITLSTDTLDIKASGYQPPIPEDQVKPYVPRPRGRGRYRGRGYRGYRGQRGGGGGRGFRTRGGGRGFRGGRFRGRGGFNDFNSGEDILEEQQIDENQEGENRPRGRGRGFRGRGRGGGRGRGRGGFRGTEGPRGGGFRGMRGGGGSRGRGARGGDGGDGQTPPRMRGRGRGANTAEQQ